MNRVLTEKRHTYDEFCQLVKDGQKADLIDGAIYMASPDNIEANELTGWFYSLLRLFAGRKKRGRVFASRVAFRLNEENSPEPDVAFVQRKRGHLIEKGRVAGPPDLAIEVVSPDSIERDYKDKRGLYEQAGVAEYWIVDPLEQKVTLLRLGADARYREIRPRGGRLSSAVLRGFWLRVEWLWQEPQPDFVDVYNEITRE